MQVDFVLLLSLLLLLPLLLLVCFLTPLMLFFFLHYRCAVSDLSQADERPQV